MQCIAMLRPWSEVLRHRTAAKQSSCEDSASSTFQDEKHQLLLADHEKELCKLWAAGLPVIDLSRYAFEALRNEEEFILYRAE